MDFEEMQVIWDTQKERRMVVLDLDALHTIVKRKARRIELGVNAMEIGMILISVATAAILAAKPIHQGTGEEKYFEAGLLLLVGAWILVGRLRRRNREQDRDPSLLGDLDRALSQVDYHISRAKTFPVWFMLPSSLILLVSFVRTHETKSPWIWVGSLAAFALSIFLVRLELRCTHLPRKRELEALRSKLLDGR